MTPEVNAGSGGVLASEDAGTPFAFAGQGNAAALEELEFPAVLALVASFAVGPLGAERVRARRPSGDVAWVEAELETLAEALDLERGQRGVTAEPVPEVAGALARLGVEGSVLEGVELAAFRRVLVAARGVAGELRRVEEDAPRVAMLLRPVPEKAIERRLELAFDDAGELLDSASPALRAARSAVRTARERLIRRLEALLRRIEGAGDGTVTIRNGRYVIPVPRDARGRPAGIIHDESASGATLFLEPTEAIELGNAFRAAEAQEEREVLKVYRELTELLRPEQGTLAGAHAMCVQVDDLAARARFAHAFDGHPPLVAPAPAPLTIRNGRHPLLLSQAGAAPNTVVPFDLDLAPAEKTVLLSGPNTGGKSVLLKATGLIVALTQSGIVPPLGAGSALPVFRRLFADIGDRQSIAASLSTFSAHVAVLRRILDEADAATLVLLDEVGSGTDPAEGGALAAAALLSLTRRGTITLATTHLGALKHLATRSPGIVNASLQFDAATLSPTYRLLKGVPGRSYGLAIARRLGVAEAVLAEAEAQVPEAERSLDTLLAAVEQRAQEQERKDAELAGRLADMENLEARLSLQAESQTARDAELKRREREAERGAREQARAYLLEARQRVEQAIGIAQKAVDEVTAREARRLVEEGVQAEARRPEGQIGSGAEGQTDAEEATAAGGVPAAVGDRVKLSTGTIGRVVEIRGDGRLVVAAGAIKLVVDAGSIRLLTDSPGPDRTPSGHSAPTPLGPSAPLEIDLRGLTGDEAEQAVLAAIDGAVLAEHPYLRIIHGKGTGALRQRVHQVVAADRRVRQSGTAPANQGGTGVTLVEFA